MAGHHHSNSQMSRINHMNQLHNEHVPFGQKLFMHPRRDAPNGVISSGYGSAVMRSSDLPSSRYAGQSHTQQNGAPGTFHGSYATYPYAGSSNSIYTPHNTQHLPALSYPHRPEDNFIPSSNMDDRRIAQKRRNPAIHPMVGANVGGYYASSSSNSQFSQHVPPNPIPAPEFRPLQIPSDFSSSRWNVNNFNDHGGSLRNVRGRHDHSSIHLAHGPLVTSSSSSTHGPPHHANANVPSLSTSVQQDRAHFPLPPSVVPPGTDGNSSTTFRERPYYPPPQRMNMSAPVATLHSSSDNLPFMCGAYAPRSVPHHTTRTYPATAFATSSNSGAISYEPAIPSYHPTAPSYLPTSASSSSVQPFLAEPAASLRHLGQSSSARSRRSRDSYHGFHTLMIEEDNLRRSAAERFMMLDQLVIHESREASDPHWDMRLDIDDMSYEELLVLGERIGNVNTGLADEKISGCVMEIARCDSARLQNDEETATCVICLDEYELKGSLGSLKCGHDFHADCIKKWLQVKNACPICKAAAADHGGEAN